MRAVSRTSRQASRPCVCGLRVRRAFKGLTAEPSQGVSSARTCCARPAFHLAGLTRPSAYCGLLSLRRRPVGRAVLCSGETPARRSRCPCLPHRQRHRRRRRNAIALPFSPKQKRCRAGRLSKTTQRPGHQCYRAESLSRTDAKARRSPRYPASPLRPRDDTPLRRCAAPLVPRMAAVAPVRLSD